MARKTPRTSSRAPSKSRDTGPAPGPEAPAAPEVVIPDPMACRVSRDIRGVEATMGDGKVWLLARTGLSKALSESRGRIFEQILLDGAANIVDLTKACYYALRLNYNLSDDELAALIRMTPPAAIVDAVAEAAVPSFFDGDRGYDDWARSALLANGLQPGSIPAEDLPHVLMQLVVTNRAVAPEKFTEVGRHVAMRGLFRGMIAQQEIERKQMRRTE